MEDDSEDSDVYDEVDGGRAQAGSRRRQGHGAGSDGWAGAGRQRDKSGGVGIKGMSGLPNLGNTCYLNAAVQALVHTKPFADYFVECSDFVPPRSDAAGGRAAKQATAFGRLDDLHLHQHYHGGLACQVC